MGFSAPGSSGAAAVFSRQVCGGHGSFGGDAYAGGVIYVACTNGVQALAYNQAARTFTPLWQGPADAFGPPIVSGGSVWDVASGGFNGGGTKLYGLGSIKRRPALHRDLAEPRRRPLRLAERRRRPGVRGHRLERERLSDRRAARGRRRPLDPYRDPDPGARRSAIECAHHCYTRACAPTRRVACA